MAPAAVSINGQMEASTLVEREKIRAAYGNWSQYVDGLPFAAGLALIMSGRWPDIGEAPAPIAIGWLAAAFTWAVGASCAFRWYSFSSQAMSVRLSRTILCTVWALHAAIWGTAVWVFWQPENAVNQAILNTITLGVMVSYFSGLTTCVPALFSALGVLTAIQWAAFFYFGGALSHVFMVAFPAFVVLMTTYGLAVGRKYELALRLRFENEALARALAEANRAKSDFLASMSHELRTPLNAVIGYSDLMRLQTLGAITPSRYAAYVDDIHASGEHLLKLINDLLDLSKIDAGKRELEFVPTRLVEVAKEALRFLEPQAERAHVAVMLDIKADAVIRADERAVKQMLINLVSNAVKFSNPGGIVVIFCDVASDGRILLGVKDTGLGMTREMQERAVEPFVQCSDALTVEGRGTGLGLPIVKGLIEGHQGRLVIESVIGKGSKIWVEFPPTLLIRQSQVAAA